MLIIIIDFGLALVYSYLSREKNVDILSQPDNTRLFVQNHFEIIDEKKLLQKEIVSDYHPATGWFHFVTVMFMKIVLGDSTRSKVLSLAF